MTTFVAGATGLTGRHVVHALVRRNLAAVAHVRPDRSGLEAVRQRFEAEGAQVDTTPWEPEAMAETFRRLRPEVIFALLGTTRKRAKAAEAQGKRSDYEAVDFGLTALLVDAAAAAEIRPRFVYLSAAGVKESGNNAYYEARAKAEAKVRESGLPYTIARPSFIVGEREDGRPLEDVGAAIGDGVLAVLGALGMKHLRDRWHSITGAELGEALVRLALDPAAENAIVERPGL